MQFPMANQLPVKLSNGNANGNGNGNGEGTGTGTGRANRRAATSRKAPQPLTLSKKCYSPANTTQFAVFKFLFFFRFPRIVSLTFLGASNHVWLIDLIQSEIFANAI